MKLSVIIPSRNEIFLDKTIDDIFNKARGDIEVIAVLDGYWPHPPPADRPNLHLLHWGRPKGMRAAINGAAAIAKGDYLLKTDAHCMFAEGFDEVLKADCDGDWIVIPSRYSLDAENWDILRNRKSRVDYHYLSFPDAPGKGIHGSVWLQRARERKNDTQYDIDDEMSFQGSCWFMPARHFHDFLGGMSEVGYGTFIQEPQEIGMKTWLGGGQIKTNKKTWYAHLHKGRRYGRGYYLSKREAIKGNNYSVDFWLNNKWKDRVHDIEWLIDKFAPVPTWPENWKELVHERI